MYSHVTQRWSNANNAYIMYQIYMRDMAVSLLCVAILLRNIRWVWAPFFARPFFPSDFLLRWVLCRTAYIFACHSYYALHMGECEIRIMHESYYGFSLHEDSAMLRPQTTSKTHTHTNTHTFSHTHTHPNTHSTKRIYVKVRPLARMRVGGDSKNITHNKAAIQVSAVAYVFCRQSR